MERLYCMSHVINSLVVQTPYTQFSNSETAEKVLSGYRMTPPENCPDDIARLMQQTWNESPSSRPSFKVHNDENFVIICMFRKLSMFFEGA
jgi:hypothetical protein